MAKQQKEKSFGIEWSTSAKKNFFEAIEYISESSIQGAGSVIDAITEALSKAAVNPQIYPSDKWKLDNDNSYRAFEVKRFRIAYKIYSDKKVIKVINFRHGRQFPASY